MRSTSTAIFRCVALLALLAVCSTAAQATLITWNGAKTGTTLAWSPATNWNPATIPNSNLDGASLQVDATGAMTLSVGTTVITLNEIRLGDTGVTYYAQTLSNGTGGSVLLDNEPAGVPAVIANEVNANTITDTISAPLKLNSNVTVTTSGTPTAGILKISGIISDNVVGNAKGITKSGGAADGKLILSGANTFAGGVTLTDGILAFGSGSTVTGGVLVNGPAGTGLLTINDGTTVDTENTTSRTVSNAQQWNGSFAFGAKADLTFDTGAITLNADPVITFNNAKTVNISSIIGETGGAHGIIKSGPGNLVLKSANTFTGASTLNAGTLTLNNARALGTGSLTINGGALYCSSAATLTGANPMTWAGDFSFNASYANLDLGTGPVTLVGNRTVTTSAANGNTLTVNGNIGDGGSGFSLTKAGTTSLTLGGANTFSGGLVVNAGTLTANSAGALGAGPVTVNSGATLRLNYNGTYACGAVTATSATVIPIGSSIKNLALTLQGGTLWHNMGGNGAVTLDNSCAMSISGAVLIKRSGGYYNGPLNIGASIAGDGKAVLNDVGGTSQDRLEIASTQQWTGGTDVKGVVNMIGVQAWGSSTGGVLPAGTVTVYPVVESTSANALLNLLNSTAGSNGGLNPNTDLVLSSNGTVYGNVYLGNGVTNVVVHSLTIDGVVKPAGFYKASDLPNFLPTYNAAYTLRVMTPDSGPAAITNLAGTSPDWMKVALTWTAPADNIDPIVSKYDIRYSASPIDSTNWTAATQVTGYPTPVAPGGAQTFTISDLTGGTTYYFAVKSADSGDNWGDLSNVAMVTTIATDSLAPAAVNDLAVADIRPSRVTLTWTATGDDGVTGAAAGYDLRYSTTLIATDADFTAATPVTGLPTPKAPGGAETINVTGLTPSTTYYFAIKVKDEASNWSVLSNVRSATTKDVDLDAPLAVTDLHVLDLTSASVTLAWTAPADQGTAGTGSYDLRYSTSPITNDAEFAAAAAATNLPTPAAAGTTQQFAVGNLQSSTTYYFALKTADMAEPANVSAMSNTVSGKTRPPVVPVVVHNPWLKSDRIADTHNLASMAATYINAYTPDGVVAPTCNQDKAINIYNNQKRRMYHWADEPPSVGGNDINDPTYNQNVFGWALCGRHACNGCTIAKAVGFGQRKIAVPGDWQMEFIYDGGNHLFHTMTTFYVMTRGSNPHIASCDEIKADNNLVLNAAAEGRACPGYLLCGDTPAWEADAVNHYSDGGDASVTTRWTGNMDLRIGQTFNRTWAAWQNQHPTPSTNADSMAGNDPPYHHEAQHDWKDYVNFPYWEPYGQVISYIHTTKATYRRWSNGTDTLAPDFRSAGYQAMLESSSNNIATFYQDAITPDLHPSAINTQGEAVFKINVPFYITDANFSGTFVKATGSDVCKVYVSSNGTSWTQVYDAPVGTTAVTNQPLRTNVFGLWTTWYVKVQMKGITAKANAGVSNFVVTTIFEHNKGSMAYLDKGTNNITLTFDNAAELQASGNVLHVQYTWKEFDGTGWTIDKHYDGYFTASPSTFMIVTNGTKVPRTESIVMEVMPLPYDPVAPGQVTGLAAGLAQSRSVPLTWTATGDDADTGTAMAYDLRYSTSPITDEASYNAAPQVPGVPAPKAAGEAESFTVMYLQSNTTYYFAIKAMDKGGNRGPMSAVVTASTTAAMGVTDLAAGAPTSAKVPLTWTAVTDGSTGTCASYDLRFSTTAIIDETTFSAATQVAGVPAPKAAGQPETFTVTYLDPSTTYYFAIKGVDAKGNALPLSNVVPVTTAAAPFVSDLAISSPGSSRMPLTWTAISDGVTGTFTSYNLRYATDPITDDASFNAATAVTGVPAPKVAGSAEAFTVTGLSGNTTYYFAIKAVDAQGRSSLLSNVASATTIIDTVRPNWIGNLKAQPSHTAKGVDLTWTAPGDYVDGGAGPFLCASYELRYSTSPILYNDGDATWNAATAIGGLTAPKAPGGAESVTVIVPTGGTMYYFAMKVKDDASPANTSEVSNCAWGKSSVNGDMVLQNGLNSYTGCIDTYIDETSTNYAGSTRMTICGYNTGNRQRGLVRFDLTSLASMNITSATLCLWAYDQGQSKGSTSFYGVYPFSHDWTATAANWTNSASGTPWSTPGGDFGETADATAAKIAPASVPAWYNWDVTARVQSWLAGSSTNYGWMVKCVDETLSLQDRLYQTETSDATHRPKLVISDLVPPKVGDANGDGRVDILDLLNMSDSWAKALGDRAYNPYCDFNNSGAVDVVDLLMLAENWPTE